MTTPALIQMRSEWRRRLFATYVGAADALQQQPRDLRLAVELALGHPQLLLGLRRSETQKHYLRQREADYDQTE